MVDLSLSNDLFNCGSLRKLAKSNQLRSIESNQQGINAFFFYWFSIEPWHTNSNVTLEQSTRFKSIYFVNDLVCKKFIYKFNEMFCIYLE